MCFVIGGVCLLFLSRGPTAREILSAAAEILSPQAKFSPRPAEILSARQGRLRNPKSAAQRAENSNNSSFFILHFSFFTFHFRLAVSAPRVGNFNHSDFCLMHSAFRLRPWHAIVALATTAADCWADELAGDEPVAELVERALGEWCESVEENA